MDVYGRMACTAWVWVLGTYTYILHVDIHIHVWLHGMFCRMRRVAQALPSRDAPGEQPALTPNEDSVHVAQA